MTYIDHVRAHLAKDLRLEWRSRDAINAMGFFAILVVVIFSFAFEPNTDESRRIAGGIIWVAILFATNVALNQSWMRETRHQVLDALRIAPAPPTALFLGKAIGNFIFVVALECIMVPLITVFYNLSAAGSYFDLLCIALLGTWALVVNGTFFATVALRTRLREMMLPLMLFPISIPALLGMVQATTSVLTGDDSPAQWIKLLSGYDIIFTVVCLLLFETVFQAE